MEERKSMNVTDFFRYIRDRGLMELRSIMAGSDMCFASEEYGGAPRKFIPVTDNNYRGWGKRGDYFLILGINTIKQELYLIGSDGYPIYQFNASTMAALNEAWELITSTGVINVDKDLPALGFKQAPP